MKERGESRQLINRSAASAAGRFMSFSETGGLKRATFKGQSLPADFEVAVGQPGLMSILPEPRLLQCKAVLVIFVLSVSLPRSLLRGHPILWQS